MFIKFYLYYGNMIDGDRLLLMCVPQPTRINNHISFCNKHYLTIHCIRNGYGSTLPNMNGIEIPDPYCESELRQRLGIATNMCYTILESPEQASNHQIRRFLIFVPQLEFSMFQTVAVQKCNCSTRRPFFNKWIGYPRCPWWRSLVACVG